MAVPALFLLLALVIGALAALLALRSRDERADHVAWMHLRAMQPTNPPEFDPAMLAGLPEPAQRFFRFAIAPGTPLLTVAEIDMDGEFSLGSRDEPGYRPMRARQILAAPHGFVFRMQLPGALPVSGSDGASVAKSWTRFRLLGVVPVARLGGNTDHLRAAFGRYVAESAFWTPAALLPGPGLAWQAVDADTARFTVSAGTLTQSVDIRVDGVGRPLSVSFMRWTDANPHKQFRLQPFGGTLADFREVQGYRLPFRVDAGNMFGTDECFVFYKAEVTAIRYPEPPA